MNEIDQLSLNPFAFTQRMQWQTWFSRIELARMALEVPGHWIECGVRDGAGLLLLHHIASVYEPTNIKRRIVGFDSFSGFPAVSEGKDGAARAGDLKPRLPESLLRAKARDLDENRLIDKNPLVELIAGDALETIPEFVSQNPHIGISMLILDFDIYQPTLVALQNFVPLMSKGAILVFDELYDEKWPGETAAFREFMDSRDYSIRKLPHDPHTSYLVL